jgi:hypothetical protein
MALQGTLAQVAKEVRGGVMGEHPVHRTLPVGWATVQDVGADRERPA